ALASNSCPREIHFRSLRRCKLGVRSGSFATDHCAMKIGPCPQCPESDGGRSKRRPSRWANNGLLRCTLRDEKLLNPPGDPRVGFEVQVYQELCGLADAPKERQRPLTTPVTFLRQA